MVVTVKTVRGLAERLAKGEALVAEGAVFAVAGLSGYALERNGDGTQMYLVRVDDGHAYCSCPDFQQRQRVANLPCKHIMAAQLAQGGHPRPPASIKVLPIDATDAASLYGEARQGIAA